MSLPAEPCARIASVEAVPGVEAIEFRSPINFLNSADRAALLEYLADRPLDLFIKSGTEMVVAGDSLSTDYTGSAGENWLEYLKDYATSSRLTWTNTAVAGRALWEVIAAYTAEVHPRRPAVTGATQTNLFFEIGVNDIAALAAGTHPHYANVAAWFAAFSGYVAGAIADGILVYPFTIPPRSDYNYVVDATRQQMNNLIKTLTNIAGLIDIARCFPVPILSDAFFVDGVHYTPEGKKRWARFVCDSLIAGRTGPPLEDWTPQGTETHGALRTLQGGIFFPSAGVMGVSDNIICRVFVDGHDGRITLTPFSGGHNWHINAGFANPAADVELGLPVVSGTLATLTGVATNNNAAAGDVGEYVNSLVASGSAVSLSTTVAANVTSISLTAGDWDVGGVISVAETAATATARCAGFSDTSATLPTDGSESSCDISSAGATGTSAITPPRKRFSLSGTTTIYLVASATFSAGTVAAYGTINARRVR